MNRSSQQYELFHVVLLPIPNSNLLASTDVCCCCADVGLHVDATAYVFQLKFFQLRDHEWTYQTKNGQRGYGDVGRSVGYSGPGVY